MINVKRYIPRPSKTQGLLILLLLLQIPIIYHTYFIKPPQAINRSTVIYNQGPQGSSNYDLWLQAGNKGTLADYLTSLTPEKTNPATPKDGKDGRNGVNGTNGNNGTDASPAAPCSTSTDANQNTLITCPDGTISVIQKPKDGESATDYGIPQFNKNTETCYLQFKMSIDRLWTDLIKDPECFNHAN